MLTEVGVSGAPGRVKMIISSIGGLNVEDQETLVSLANASGLAGRRLLAEASDPSLLAKEADLTREAIDRQLFDAPFYFYRDEPFWGTIG